MHKLGNTNTCKSIKSQLSYLSSVLSCRRGIIRTQPRRQQPIVSSKLLAALTNRRQLARGSDRNFLGVDYQGLSSRCREAWHRKGGHNKSKTLRLSFGGVHMKKVVLKKITDKFKKESAKLATEKKRCQRWKVQEKHRSTGYLSELRRLSLKQ